MPCKSVCEIGLAGASPAEGVVGLDSGLGERKKLAQELGYAGALDGSAEMNTWLHKQVMTKVAESGGRVPENLKT